MDGVLDGDALADGTDPTDDDGDGVPDGECDGVTLGDALTLGDTLGDGDADAEGVGPTAAPWIDTPDRPTPGGRSSLAGRSSHSDCATPGAAAAGTLAVTVASSGCGDTGAEAAAAATDAVPQSPA